MDNHILHFEEFRYMRRKLFELLLSVTENYDEGTAVKSDQVILTPKGAKLISKLLFHVIATKTIGNKCVVGAVDEEAFPIIGTLLLNFDDDHMISGGILLMSKNKGPDLVPGNEVILITDRIRWETTSHVCQLRGTYHCNVKHIIALVSNEDHDECARIAEVDLELTALFTLRELRTGVLDESHFLFA